MIPGGLGWWTAFIQEISTPTIDRHRTVSKELTIIDKISIVTTFHVNVSIHYILLFKFILRECRYILTLVLSNPIMTSECSLIPKFYSLLGLSLMESIEKFSVRVQWGLESKINTVVSKWRRKVDRLDRLTGK